MNVLSGGSISFKSIRKRASALIMHPMFNHFKLVLSFFISKFLLSTMDIVTDLLTALEFFSSGHYYFGLLTILLVFAPFAARVVHNCIKIAMCFKITKDFNMPFFQRFGFKKNNGRLKVLFQELPCFIWNFPLFQPIK
jgi:hypothetical protein